MRIQGLLLVYLASACSSTPEITTRTISLHTPAACAVPEGAYAQYFARGDFQPTTSDPAEDDLPLASSGLLEHLPAAARSLGVQVSAEDSVWIGVGEVPDTGNVDVLLWGVSRTCALSKTFPAVTNPAFGAVDAKRAIVSGGRPTSASVIPSSWVVDLATGIVTMMATGPLTVRERATITPFGTGALLAGGIRSDDPNGLVDNAEFWDPIKNDFDGKRITLSLARADHGAVTLGSGDVLIVGGIGSAGKPLATPEIVLAKEGRATTSGLPLLTARTSPTLLRLSSGDILIAGGSNAAGDPIALLELLSPDAHTLKRSIPLVAHAKQAFAPLDGGGALAVLVPEASDPPDFKNVWRISGDGTPTPLAQLANLTDARLFSSSGGGAILWTGSQWLEFLPWKEQFNPLTFSDGPTPLAIVPERGLALWLVEDSGLLHVSGRRFSIRTAFAVERVPLAQLDLGPVAPDRSPSNAGMLFDPARGLTLPDNTAAFVADGRYADFVLDLTVAEGAPPTIVLRDDSGASYTIGAGDCPIPLGPTPHVQRIGHAVGTDTKVCQTPLMLGRVAIGFLGQNSTLRDIRLQRMVN